MIEQTAYAKINLSLEVLGKRTDGYHDLISVMQMVDLHDTLTFAPCDTIEVECQESALAAEAEANLVLRSARLLRDRAGVSEGARIRLEKRIPVAAGLAGGSSDAAATLRGLCELWSVAVPGPELASMAASIGSDVPFFLDGPTALVEGRGERVTRLPALSAGWAVLVCSQYNLADKTRRLYSSLTRDDMTEGAVTWQLIRTLGSGEFPPPGLYFNSFERVAYQTFEGLEGVRRQVLRAGGADPHLSGSGPTLYILFPLAEANRAYRLHAALQAEGLSSYLTRTVA